MGTLAEEVWHEKDAVPAADHKLVGRLNGNGDARGNITVASVVQASVVGRAEDKFTGNGSPNLRAYGVLRGEAERVLRVVTFRCRGLHLIAETQVYSHS